MTPFRAGVAALLLAVAAWTTPTTEAVGVQFLSPEGALVHIEWQTRGDLDFDLKPSPPRTGLFS